MLLYVKGSIIRQLRQFRGIPSLWRQCIGQCPGNLCQASSFHSTEWSPGSCSTVIGVGWTFVSEFSKVMEIWKFWNVVVDLYWVPEFWVAVFLKYSKVLNYCTLIGASRPPTGSPMGLPTFFFLFFFFFFFRRIFLPPHFRWPFVVKKTTDWAEILHNHTYGHASGRGKKYFRCALFSFSYLSKITQKSIP